jgi:hypothetical protein
VIARLQAALKASGAQTQTSAPGDTSVSETHAAEIIFCIGKEFSFKSAIRALERTSPAQTAAFYADGCHAVISSTRPAGRGEIRLL